MAATYIKRVMVHRGNKKKRSLGQVLADCLNYGKDENKTAIAAATEYGLNYDKTSDGVFVSTYACSPERCDIEFEMAHEEYRRITGLSPRNDVALYHIRQSFKPRIVRWRGLKDKPGEELKHKTHFTEESAREHMAELERAGCTEISYEKGDEISPERANELGMELAKRFTRNGHAYICCTHVDKAHIHNHIYFHSVNLERTKKFREPYFAAKVIRRISDQICLEHGFSVIREPGPNRGRDLWVQRDSKGQGFLIDLQNNLKVASSPGYAHWAKLHNIKEMAKMVLYMQSAKLNTYDKLQKAVAEITEEFAQVKGQIATIDDRQEQIRNLQKHIGTYRKTKDTYAQYRKSKNEAFYTEHQADIDKHIKTKEYFDRLSLGKLPTMAELKQEYATLQAEKGKLYQEYHPLRRQLKDLQNSKKTVATLQGIKDVQPIVENPEIEREF